MELESFKGLMSDMFAIKEKLTELDGEKKELTAELNKMKAVAMVALAENDMKTFKAGGMALTAVDKKSVRILDKNLLMDWLDEKGILRDSLNVSAAKATSIWNEEFELAKINKDVSFLTGDGIPGLSEPETHTIISMRGRDNE